MLGATTTLPLASGTVTLNRIRDDGYSAEYYARGTGMEFRINVRHSRTNGTILNPSQDRHNYEVMQKIYATESTPERNRKVYVVIQQDPDDTDKELADALGDNLIASTNALVAELLNWQS